MRLLLADDHPLFLDAVAERLMHAFPEAVIMRAGTVAEAEKHMQALARPNLVILDYSLPDGNGLEAVARLRKLADDIPVLIMSGVAEPAQVQACMTAGARGFVPKTLDAAAFAQAIRVVLDGGTYVPADYEGQLAAAKASISQVNFTDRELDVLRELVAGGSNKEIARALDVQEVTIKLHMTRIFQKMSVKNRAQAALKAVELGIQPAEREL
ncbi:MAG: response regulator transcription factor [Alphaproteobacteria bacterium]